MGLFSSIIDVGGGLIAGGGTKRAIDQASQVEQAGLSEGIVAGDALRDRTVAATDPFSGAGTRATTTLEGLISGDQRLAPTAGELFALERGQRTVDTLAAGNKGLFSGQRISDSIQRAEDISTGFRQQDISNLQNLAGRGLQATGLNINADVNTTNAQNRLRELIGGVQSAAILGKDAISKGNIANISGNLSNLVNDFTRVATLGAG